MKAMIVLKYGILEDLVIGGEDEDLYDTERILQSKRLVYREFTKSAREIILCSPVTKFTWVFQTLQSCSPFFQKPWKNIWRSSKYWIVRIQIKFFKFNFLKNRFRKSEHSGDQFFYFRSPTNIAQCNNYIQAYVNCFTTKCFYCKWVLPSIVKKRNILCFRKYLRQFMPPTVVTRESSPIICHRLCQMVQVP